MTAKCWHCGTETVAFGPAPHKNSIGICPGCNKVLMGWVPGDFPSFGEIQIELAGLKDEPGFQELNQQINKQRARIEL